MYLEMGKDELAKQFEENLLDTNRGYNYYVDWSNISGYDKYSIEIHAMDVLINCKEEDFYCKFRELLEKKGIDPDGLDVNWESIRSKELEYDESLVDILYSIVNYELEHRGYAIFGINMGYESTLYFIVPQKAFSRIDNEPELFTIFDIGFLETIYNEIYEVVGELGTENVKVGDFLEKRGNEYYTLFADASKNVIIENIDENDESKVKIIL